VHACNRCRILRLETLSSAPPVFRISGLLSARECATIMGLARGASASPSEVSSGAGGLRRSSTAFVRLQSSPELAPLAERASCAMGLRTEAFLAHAEAMQVVHYPVGGFYDVHVDASEFQPRHATLLCYLASPGRGGETVFPLAGELGEGSASLAAFEDARARVRRGAWVGEPSGLSVRPEAGDAVLWYNLGEAAVPDLRTCHAALAVGEGEKWVANLWISAEAPG